MVIGGRIKGFNRVAMIPYGKQSIDNDDIQAVIDVLRSDWLTTGPKVAEFEQAVSEYVGAKYAVAVSSGTAALHSAMYALGIGPGDEVIVPPMTFVATANCVVYQGGTPIFADVNPETLLINPDSIIEKLSNKTKAIIAVDFAGQPCDYDRLQEIAQKNNLWLVADGCHALGAEYKGKKVGSLADMTVFSFHPVKHITTGEGGMVVTNNNRFEERLKIFRNHGISTDFRQRERLGSWRYEMIDLGFNYRITDFQCALGNNQLSKLESFIEKRRQIAETYDSAFAKTEYLSPLKKKDGVRHAYHLYVVKIDFDRLSTDRNNLFNILRNRGIGVNVHYIPIHLHPFYRKRFNTNFGICPVSEHAYEKIFSLPIHPILKINELNFITETIQSEVAKWG